MVKDKNVLLICRSPKDKELLSRIKIDGGNKYIVASDDMQVQEAAKGYRWVSTVCFIEKVESFYNVAEDVLKFLEIINKWLKSFGDGQRGVPEELLFWIHHAEGGMTTQRIQDLLLLIRSYSSLISDHKISKVIILSYGDAYWEDSILVQVARSRDVDIQIIGGFRVNALRRRSADFLRTIATELYRLMNIFRSKLSNKLRRTKQERFDKEIVIQPCGSEPKHLQYTIPLMKSINERGYNSVALCWQIPEGARRIRSKDLYAEELENWLPMSAILTGYSKIFIVWVRTILRRKEFLLNSDFQYQSVDIAKLLWPSFFYFFAGELPSRYRLMVAAKKYFEYHSPIAVKFCTTILPESVIPFHCMQKNRRPVIFHQPWPADSPYHRHLIPVDLVFSVDDKHKEQLLQEGFLPDNIVIIGKLNRGESVNFKKRYSQKQSLSHLKIPSTFSIYILYDPGYILRGHMATSEQATVTECLLDLVKNNASVALIVKLHPSHHSGTLESHIESHSLENVFLIDSKKLPDHCLNASDLVITKYSAIGNEAMHFERPVMSVILDGEARFRTYGNSAEYIHSIEGFRKLLNLLISDQNYRAQWTSSLKERAVIFLNLYDSMLLKSPYELIADAVDMLIKKKGILQR